MTKLVQRDPSVPTCASRPGASMVLRVRDVSGPPRSRSEERGERKQNVDQVLWRRTCVACGSADNRARRAGRWHSDRAGSRACRARLRAGVAQREERRGPRVSGWSPVSGLQRGDDGRRGRKRDALDVDRRVRRSAERAAVELRLDAHELGMDDAGRFHRIRSAPIPTSSWAPRSSRMPRTTSRSGSSRATSRSTRSSTAASTASRRSATSTCRTTAR